MEPETTLTALDIIKAIGAIFGTFVIVYAMYLIKISQSRIKTIENELSGQRVTNQSFTEYRKYKDLRDMEFTDSIKRIGDTLEDWRGEFNDKFAALTKMIHEIQLDRAKDKK